LLGTWVPSTNVIQPLGRAEPAQPVRLNPAIAVLAIKKDLRFNIDVSLG
jgi:hypothetical protein